MSFLAPGFLIAAAVAACGIVALHLIVRRRPRATPFPTARFVPDEPVAARKRAINLSDLLLLLVRVLAILLVGAALARPVIAGVRKNIIRVFAADVSGSVASIGEVRDSVRSAHKAGDVVIAFDTVARVVSTPDSLVGGGAAGNQLPGSLSAGLIAAMRAGSSLRARADSVELVIVSPATEDEGDRATSAIRSVWPGRVRLVRVAAARHSKAQTASAVAFAGAERPAFAVAQNRIDTVGAVIAGGHVVVAPFERRWRFIADSLGQARVIARWVDGQPAAIEKDSGGACTKSVLVSVDSTGDIALRPDFIAFRNAIAAPCRRAQSGADTGLAVLLAGRSERLASTGSLPAAVDGRSMVARWMILAAIVLAIVEMVLRRPRVGRTEDK
ncbi:MAG: BatA domain-containing protein [Gemmatimonadaceae bacterium]